MNLTVGKIAPVFELSNQLGEKVNLSSFRGKMNVVVYFYPRALTPGCTKQACGIRDTKKDLQKLAIEVLGISTDAVEKLQKFTEKQKLNFQLLSDPEHKVAAKYGAWGKKKFMGKTYDGLKRMTFIIDKKGKLRHIMEKVNTKTHHEDVLAWVRENL